jgi:hypothetical protein
MDPASTSIAEALTVAFGALKLWFGLIIELI